MNIKIYLDRYTETCCVPGTQFEQNATVIKFDFSELDFLDDECVKTIHFFHDDLSEENYIGDSIIQNDEFKIPKSITEYENVLAFIQITKEDFIWKTKSFNLDFFKSLDVDKTLDEDQLGILQELILEVQQIKTDTADEYKQLAEEETKKFNDNATAKTNTFNSNATSKLETYNSNATSKETAYNENATSKLNEYNENHTSKMTAYNDNTTEKITEYNDNAAEKIAEYDEHIEDLDNIVSKKVVSGESILIDDALKYKIFDAKIDGNVNQTTTTGKQMLQMCPEVHETNGITFTKNEDGSIIINGTATNTAFCNINGSYTDTELNRRFQLKKDSYYTLYLKNQVNGLYMGVRTSSVSGAILNTQNQELKAQQYTGEDDDTGLAFLNVATGTTLKNLVVYPMIAEGQFSELEWEEYTGGEPSPNPDYPQDIEVINGNVKIINCGKNLITKQGLSTSLNENDYYDSRTSFLTPGADGWGHLECDNFSGTSSKYINIFIKKKNIYVKENSKYTLFIELKNVSNLSYLTINQLVNDDLFQESRGINTGKPISDGIYKFYVTTKEELSNDMVLRIFTSVKSENVISFDMRLMILEGDWTDKEVEYEQYKSNEYTIDLQNNELVKLTDDIKDTIEIDKNRNVSLNKRIGKISLAGTENIILDGELSNVYRFICYNVNSLLNYENAAISNYLINERNYTSDKEHFYISTNNAFLFMKKDLFSSKDNALVELKQMLSTNNMIIYSDLIEPPTTSLGQLANFKTYAGINHFFLEANISTNFEVTYAQDLQKVISKQQEEINELKTLLSSKATSAMLLDNYANDLLEEV